MFEAMLFLHFELEFNCVVFVISMPLCGVCLKGVVLYQPAVVT